MTAALAQQSRHRHDGLQPLQLARDLYQVAELVELCFADQMDSSGRAAVQEMKFVASLGPLLGLLSLLGLKQQFGLGYVWREDRRVVGNLSLFPAGMHPYLGRGYLIANVAVHPDFRRRGIARALMQAGIEQARQQGGQWALLQVEAENGGAISLYRSLGFDTFETLAHWKARRPPTLPPVPESTWQARPRKRADGSGEIDLIFNRARQGGMTWTRPLNQAAVRGDWLSRLDDALEGPTTERWVLPDPAQPGRLLGSAWIGVSGWQQARVSLFIDPGLDDPVGRLALVYTALNRPLVEHRSVTLETTRGDPVVDEVLKAAGFEPVRHLTQMRKRLEA